MRSIFPDPVEGRSLRVQADVQSGQLVWGLCEANTEGGGVGMKFHISMF